MGLEDERALGTSVAMGWRCDNHLVVAVSPCAKHGKYEAIPQDTRTMVDSKHHARDRVHRGA